MMDVEQKRNITLRQHPEYERLLQHWLFLELTYNGGREWFNEHIFKYYKEGSDEYKSRIERAYRFNHTREVVDLVTKYLFKAHIVRNKEDASDAVLEFWRSPSQQDASAGIDRFMRDVATRSSIYGRCYVVIDSNFSGESVTLADAKRDAGRVYGYIAPPQRVKDMSFDDEGALNWILIEEEYRDDEDPFESTGQVMVRYRLWTRDSWYLFKQSDGSQLDAGYETVDSGDHMLGEVPVIPVDHIIGDGSLYSSPSMVGDAAYLDRAVANYLSNLDAIIQDQTFSQLVIPAQSLPVGTDGSFDKAHRKLIEMGTKRIFTYDASDGSPSPHYISPDAKQAELILTVVRQIINEIYHSVGVAGERTKQDNAIGIDNSSGVAKAYDFERVNSLLTSKGASLQAVENRIVELVERWHGSEEPAPELVTYPDTFDTRALKDEFDIAMQLGLLEAPDLMRRRQMEVLVDKLFPQLKRSLLEEMKRDLGSWPESPTVDTAPPFADEPSRQGQVVDDEGEDA